MTTLQTEQAGRVLTVRMSNPPRNFMTGRMVAELEEMVRRADEDPSIGAVVLTGAVEGAFITHYDVAEILAGSEGVGAQVSPAVAGGALRATGALGRIPGAADALRRTPAAGLVELRRIHDVFRQMNRSGRCSWPRSTGWRWAAAASWRWPATSASWPPATAASGCPRSRSA